MNREKIEIIAFLAFLLFGFTPIAAFSKGSSITNQTNNASQPTVSIPKYTSGIILGGSFLYLQPSLSDANLEFGSFLTLTPFPPTLTARLLQIRPGYRSAYHLLLGYQLPNSDGDITASYTSFHQNFSDSLATSQLNELIQDYLGDSWASSSASANLLFRQVDLKYGHHLILGHTLGLHFLVGVRYVQVQRNFSSQYNQIIPPSPNASFLNATEHSNYHGAGPLFGTEFSFPIKSHFSLMGKITTALLLGRLTSNLNANALIDNVTTNFSATHNVGLRVGSAIYTALGIRYKHRIGHSHYGIFINLGYQVSDYINLLNRLNPNNGFTRNRNPQIINLGGSLGFNGPFIRLTFQPMQYAETQIASFTHAAIPSGLSIAITNFALKPIVSSDDLEYAVINLPNGSTTRVQAKPIFNWAGALNLAYIFKGTNLGVQASYMHFNETIRDAITAGSGETISSLNASGPAVARFTNANSKARYNFNQVDVAFGSYYLFLNRLMFHPYVGVRFAEIQRRQNNGYLGGMPGIISAEKFSNINSNFWGAGPLFGANFNYFLTKQFSIITQINLALLVGTIKSTLQLNEVNNVGFATFTSLSSGPLRFVVPSAMIKLGFRYTINLSGAKSISIGAGYQVSEYFKAINLLFPTFRTGLEQTNTSFGLHGFYLTLAIHSLAL